MLVSEGFMAAVPNLFGTRDQFQGRQFSMKGEEEVVSGCFRHIAFIVHFIYIIVTSNPHQIIRH